MKMGQDKLTIIVPSYNEEKNIEPLVNQIEECLGKIDFEILYVDDSTDNTPQIISKIAEKDPHVKLFHRDKEKGLATAVLKGFEIAEGNILAVMDADLQHPPKILRGMYAAIQAGADICIPSRFITGGSDGGLNWYRKFVSGTARYLGKVLLPCLRKISDPTGGLFMVRKEAVMNGGKLQPIGWKIMIEVLALAKYTTIIEIPYAFCDRFEGESKLSKKVIVEYIKQCIDLRRRGNKQKNVQVIRWSQSKMLEEEKEI